MKTINKMGNGFAHYKAACEKEKKIAGKGVIGVNKVGLVNYINFINPSTFQDLRLGILII